MGNLLFLFSFYYQENLIIFVLEGHLSGLINYAKECAQLWEKVMIKDVWVCTHIHACVV